MARTFSGVAAELLAGLGYGPTLSDGMDSDDLIRIEDEIGDVLTEWDMQYPGGPSDETGFACEEILGYLAVLD